VKDFDLAPSLDDEHSFSFLYTLNNWIHRPPLPEIESTVPAGSQTDPVLMGREEAVAFANTSAPTVPAPLVAIPLDPELPDKNIVAGELVT